MIRVEWIAAGNLSRRNFASECCSAVRITGLLKNMGRAAPFAGLPFLRIDINHSITKVVAASLFKLGSIVRAVTVASPPA